MAKHEDKQETTETAPLEPVAQDDSIIEDAVPMLAVQEEAPAQPQREAPPCPVCGKSRGGKVEVYDFDFINQLVHIEGCTKCGVGLVVFMQTKLFPAQQAQPAAQPAPKE